MNQTKTNIFIGLDIGSTHLKSVAIDFNRNQVVSIHLGKHDQESDPFRIAALAEVLIQKTIHDCSGFSVKGVGICGQMHGALLLSQDSRPLLPFISWQDNRASETLRELGAIADDKKLKPGHTLSILHYLKTKNLLPESTHKVVLISDFIAAHLARTRADIMHVTNAASTGCSTADFCAWDEDLIRGAGLNLSIFPRIVSTPTAIGTLFNQPEGIPVFVSVGDQQASLSGSDFENESDISINFGTGAQLSTFQSWPESKEHGFELRPYFQNRKFRTRTGLPGGRFLKELSFEEIAKVFYKTYKCIPNQSGRLIAAGSIFHENKEFRETFEAVFMRKMHLSSFNQEGPAGAARFAFRATF